MARIFAFVPTEWKYAIGIGGKNLIEECALYFAICWRTYCFLLQGISWKKKLLCPVVDTVIGKLSAVTAVLRRRKKKRQVKRSRIRSEKCCVACAEDKYFLFFFLYSVASVPYLPGHLAEVVVAAGAGTLVVVVWVATLQTIMMMNLLPDLTKSQK